MCIKILRSIFLQSVRRRRRYLKEEEIVGRHFCFGREFIQVDDMSEEMSYTQKRAQHRVSINIIMLAKYTNFS